MATGHVEQLRSGRFRAVVYAGRDPVTGQKRYLKESFDTAHDAEAARARMLAQVEVDAHPDRSATVAVLLRRWMEVADHELTTQETTQGYVRRTLVPALGDMPVRKLQHRVDVLDRLYIHLRRCNTLCDGRNGGPGHVCRPMAPATVRRIHAILSVACNYGVAWGWMERNPAEYAHPPKLARRRAKPPAPEQVARLLNVSMASDVELGLFLWLAVTTGARRGELTGLRWSDIDHDAAQLSIATSYVVRAGQRRLKATKTDEERRLSLDALSIDLLREFHRAREEALSPARLGLPQDAFVFTPDPLGQRPWHPDHWTHAYRRAADVVGIEQPLKNLRHFNATQLLAAGVALSTTAGRLGHGDGGATTLRVYANWTPPADRRAADALAKDLDELRRRDREGAHSPAAHVALRRVARPIRDVLTERPEASTFAEIAGVLNVAIRDGRLPPMAPFPTVTEVAAHFGVARSTAQRATSLLGAQGWLEKRGGRWHVRGVPSMPEPAATVP
ncbi:MAG: tyrosine-type recombinase/integrase [Actinomycetales bacterium]